jgi:2-polyprenyl-3-methyl-5-hydroxy-6-metoxy-1,4-benzoquinol methylase
VIRQSLEDPSIATSDRCWCGSVCRVQAPHRSYVVCRDCGTAKLKAGLATGQDVVVDEASHLYGDHYWHDHMPKFGCEPITRRARTDLVERAQYWLQKVLEYRLPPGRALEIGCAHGGFVKLLTTAGYDAIGMEMSPAIISLSRRWFGVNVIQGPIEHVSEPLGTFDLIVMLDVLEHLADPVSSLYAILEHLSPMGILVIQTPCYEKISDSTWRMFHPPEHTFLFSRSSVSSLLKGLGLSYVQFEPPMFRDDMFLFASASPMTLLPVERACDALMQTPDGRIVLAMQEMYSRVKQLEAMDPVELYGIRSLGKAVVRAILKRMGIRR